jgi:hypothetical protein
MCFAAGNSLPERIDPLGREVQIPRDFNVPSSSSALPPRQFPGHPRPTGPRKTVAVLLGEINVFFFSVYITIPATPLTSKNGKCEF